MTRFTGSGELRRALIAWLVIAGIVTLVLYQNSSRTTARTNETGVRDIQIQLQAKLAVALKEFQSRAGVQPSPSSNESADRVLREMDRNALTPEHAIRTAVIAGELKGKDEALLRLDRLSGSDPSPDVLADIATLQFIYGDSGRGVDQASRDRLIQRHDYFAQVALAWGVDSNMEPRRSIESAGLLTAMVSTLIVLALGALLVISAGLMITALLLVRNGRMRPAYVPDPSAKTEFLESFALYLVLFVGLALVSRQLGLVGLYWQWLALLILALAVYWTVREGKTALQQQLSLGWHRGAGWGREIAAGIVGYVAGISFVALGFFATFILIRLSGSTPSHPITQMFNGNWWQILQLYGVACILAPIVEETMFRGALFHHLRRRLGWIFAAPIVGFIFAILHPQGWVAVPVLGSLAIVMAALREWRGSLIAPIVAHACNNFIAITAALLLLR